MYYTMSDYKKMNECYTDISIHSNFKRDYKSKFTRIFFSFMNSVTYVVFF